MSELEQGRPGKPLQALQLRLAPAEAPKPPHWNDLADPADEAAFCSAWLSLQCARMTGVTAGLLVLRQPEKGTPAIAASWTARGADGLADLSGLAERALMERRTIVSSKKTGPSAAAFDARGSHSIAVPLGAGGHIIAAAAVALAPPGGATPQDAERIADELRWGAGWLEALPWVRRLEGSSADLARAFACLDFLAVIGEQSRLLGMTIAIANDLATRLRCDRVSVGLRGRGGRIRLNAISNSATFKHQSELADAIENAMEEAVDQRRSAAYPPLAATERAVTMAHRALAQVGRSRDAAALSVVLADGQGQPIAAITFERHTQPFDTDTLQLAEAIAALLGPIVGLQMRANRLVAGRAIDWIGDRLGDLFGPRRPALKLGTACAIALVVGLALAKGEHRVAAKAVLEAEVQRAAVAPFEGFIRTASVRAGDTVRSGDLLAALDDRDLLLDRAKWRAERDKLLQRQRQALATHDRTNLVVLESQIRQADSQLALAEEKLARSRIVAPFDGIVVAGDLSQMLGSPVEKGKALFEIAPLNVYRLVVHVDERDIRYIALGQKGTVALAGMPWTPLPLELRKITPVTIPEEGRNTFRVEARLTEPGLHLRPGMEGVAKIETGQRPILWIWTRAVIEWLRLAAWRYLP
jgi:RND family efflux transporter MFP subunit